MFVSHFQNILGPEMHCQSPDLSKILLHGVLTNEEALSLMTPVTISEIEDVIKAANSNKAPGLDGFNAHFFKVSWPIISKDVCASITDFFKHGSML